MVTVATVEYRGGPRNGEFVQGLTLAAVQALDGERLDYVDTGIGNSNVAEDDKPIDRSGCYRLDPNTFVLSWTYDHPQDRKRKRAERAAEDETSPSLTDPPLERVRPRTRS